MEHFNKLTYNRKLFIKQLYNLISSQFEEQNRIIGNNSEIIEELENNSEYIQRVFIDASWGMGKSYFATSLIELINEKNNNLSIDEKIEVLRFNAWETDYFSDPMKSLIGEFNEYKLINSEISEKAEKILINVTKEIGAKLFKNLILKKFNFNDDDIENIKKFFSGINESGLQEYKNYKKIVNDFKESLNADKKRKVVIIDELDRCRPTYAIELLETIKHIFNVKNIIFIFLVNKEQLNSIVNTMYISNDKSSEYFEKFYDIQFKLPEVDYNDFINIEYEKYEKLETYNVDKGVTKERNSFLEMLFLEAFKSNIDTNNSASSIRSFLKIFRKFKILLNSLSDGEKSSFPLMVSLIIYVLEHEFGYEKSNEYRKIIFLKTFFLLKDKQKNFFIYKPEELYENYEVKEKFKNIQDVLSFFYEIFYNKQGYSTISGHSSRAVITSSIALTDTFQPTSRETIVLSLDNEKIIIDNLYFSAKTDSFGNSRILILPSEYFNKNRNNYIAIIEYYTYYHINLLFDWCKEKYNFIMRNKESFI